ncbi:MAG: pyridoxamine 5'-phosphate oxidase family protein [Ktedonobacterales bacterium]
MQDPITTIDLGHSSSPDAVATPWEETRRVLETAEVFWLSTVRADGRPHVTPVAAAWLDGTLYFGTGAIAQKLKHLRGNPHVVLTTGCNHLATGLDIVVEGDAASVTDTAVHERFHQQQAILWGEGWPIQLRDGVLWDESTREPLLLFAVTPTKIFAYARGDQWSQTRYQF